MLTTSPSVELVKQASLEGLVKACYNLKLSLTVIHRLEIKPFDEVREKKSGGVQAEKENN